MSDVLRYFSEYEKLSSKKAQLEIEIDSLSHELNNKTSEYKALDSQLESLRIHIEKKILERKTPDKVVRQNYINTRSKTKVLFRDKEYKPHLTYYDKVLYVIKKVNRCMTIRDIVDALITLEPSEDDRKLMTSLSSVLSTSIQTEDDLKRYRDHENDMWKYGLSKWFDGDKVKPEYIRPIFG